MRDHPVIEQIETWGYPKHMMENDVFCEECGDDITIDDRYYDESHENLCEKCLLYLHKQDW